MTAQRPSFRDLLLTLLSIPDAMISLAQEALDTDHLAGVLGSPLKAGQNMYSDLQNRYAMKDERDYQVY